MIDRKQTAEAEAGDSVTAEAEAEVNSWVDFLENGIKLLGLLFVAGAALSASFAHVHDWTVDVLVAATGQTAQAVSWLGWVNAICSELIPLLGLLSLRRRLAAGLPLRSFALALVIGGAVMSLSAQLAWVGGMDTGLSAWLLSTLPALTFMGLSKLVVGDLDVARKRKRAAADEAGRKRKAEAETRRRIERAEAEAEAARRAEAAAISAHAEAEAQWTDLHTAARAEAEAERQRADEAEQRAAVAQAEAETRLAAVDQTGAARAAEDIRAWRDRCDRLAAQRDELAAQLAAQRPARTRRPPAGDAPLKLSDGSPVPVVEGNTPATVAAVLNAQLAEPDATQGRLGELAGVSARTVRNVLTALQPA
jgi:hypothetical protein